MNARLACAALAALVAGQLLAWVPPATGAKKNPAPGDGRRDWNAVKAAVASVLPRCGRCLDGTFNDIGPLDLSGTLTAEEERTQYVMWSMLTVPMLTVDDPAKRRPETQKLFKNLDLQNVSQDFVCRQAYPVYAQNGAQVFIKDCWGLNCSMKVVALYNPTDAAVALEVPFAACELDGKVTVNDVLDGAPSCKGLTGAFKATVPPHGVKLYRFFGQKALMRRVYGADTAVPGGRDDLHFNYVFAKANRDYAMTVTPAKECGPFAVQVNGLYLKRGCTGVTKLAAPLFYGDNFVRIVSEKGGVPKIDQLTVE